MELRRTMKESRLKPIDSKLAATAIAWLFCVPAAHADLNYGVSVGVGHSDNIERVPEAETDETIGTAGVELDWVERTRRLEADVSVDLSYFKYFDDTFESEVVGTADGSVKFAIVPQRLRWLVQDTFGQAQRDPFTPITPDNREDLNYFTTGPELTMPLGSAATLRAFALLSRSTYEVSPLDSDRTSFGFGVVRQVSQRSSLSVNGTSQDVDFKASGASDYNLRSAFLNYSTSGSRTTLDADFGYSWLEPDDGEESGGPLAKLTVRREVSASSVINLELGTRFTDAAESLRGALEGGAVGGPDISSSSDPFVSRTASLGWSFHRNRTGVSVGASYSEDEYENQTSLDRTRLTYQASFNRHLNPALDVELQATLNDEDYANADVQADDMNLLARVNWRAGRTITLSLSFERADRDTSNGLNEFVENRAMLTVAYRPRGAATSGAGR
jgi:hypothetical protein